MTKPLQTLVHDDNWDGPNQNEPWCGCGVNYGGHVAVQNQSWMLCITRRKLVGDRNNCLDLLYNVQIAIMTIKYSAKYIAEM